MWPLLPGLLLWSLLCGHSASTGIFIFISIFILISISILLLPPCSLPTGAGGGGSRRIPRSCSCPLVH